jgi:hypothetical protein
MRGPARTEASEQMHATMRQHGYGDIGQGIRGTFYPGDQAAGQMSSVIPKLLVGIVAFALVRTIIAGKRHHGEGGRRGRRHEAIAEFHRQLHATEEKPVGGEEA